MNRGWGKAALAVMVLSSATAWAHDLRCEKLVNGAKFAVVDKYPTELQFTTTVINTNATQASTMLSAEDPLLANHYGWQFQPPAPQSIPPGDQLSFTFPIVIKNQEECLQLQAGLGGAGALPFPVPFTNTFRASWDSGSCEDSVEVHCLPRVGFPCDPTVYISDGAPQTGIYRLDTDTGALSLLTQSFLPLDSLAFNRNDGLLYALGQSGELVQIGPDGQTEIVDFYPLLGSRVWHAATWVSPNRLVLLSKGSPGLVAQIDLDSHALLNVTDTLCGGGLSDVYGVAGMVEGFSETTGRFIRVDPATGLCTDVAAPATLDGVPASGAVMPAAWSQFGNPMVMGANGGTPPLNHVFTADGSLTVLTTHSLATGAFSGELGPDADGASCSQNATAPTATRAGDYWSTRTAAVERCLAAGPISLGQLGTIGRAEEALGLLWASPMLTSTGQERSRAARAGLKAARERLIATCNERVLGAVAPTFDEADGTLSSTVEADGARLEALAQRLRAHNVSGARTALSPTIRFGQPDPALARKRAVEPVLR